jgi:hypothetical protein
MGKQRKKRKGGKKGRKEGVFGFLGKVEQLLN